MKLALQILGVLLAWFSARVNSGYVFNADKAAGILADFHLLVEDFERFHEEDSKGMHNDQTSGH